jgi:hypothetical protein
MTVVTIMSIGETSKATGTTGAYLRLSGKLCAPWIWTTRQKHDTILRKELHNGIQIMPIERVKEILQSFNGYWLVFAIFSRSCLARILPPAYYRQPPVLYNHAQM